MAAKGKKSAKVVEPPKAAPVAKGRLFGAQLGSEVPKIITLSLSHLRENAINEEGLFRISGPVEEVQQLKERWESGKDVDLKKFSPHTVAGTMKLFLRELPEPLLSYQFYSAFITTDAITNNDSRIASVRKLLSLLPRTNCEILKAVMEFFHEMLPHKAKTKMTSANLAIIIAPNILRCRVESVHQIMRDAPHVQSVIRCMIDDFHSLFQRPIEPAQRRRTIHDFTAGDSKPDDLVRTEGAASTPAPEAATPAAAPAKDSVSGRDLKLTLTPAEPSHPGLLSPRIQEITVEIASTVPSELRSVLQHVANRFVELRSILQKATHSTALAAIMQLLVACSHVAEGQPLPEGQTLPVLVASPPAADARATEAQLLKDMLKHFFVIVHKKIASLARAAAKSETCPPVKEVGRLLDSFFAPAPAGAPAPEITFVALRTVIIRYLDDLVHRLSFLQIELSTPNKNYSPLLASLSAQLASLKGAHAEPTDGRPPLEVLAALQAGIAERSRELVEDTILLPDETGLRRLIAVASTAVAMRRELVRALDQPMPEAALQVPTPKNESGLYSVRSDAIKSLARIQHKLLPQLRKELTVTPSEQRSMTIGQIVRSVKAALDQPDEKRDYLKEKVITEAGEAVADEDRGRLQTLQEVIGFVFVAVEGALTNLRADLDASTYEATATGQLLQDIDAFLTLNLDPTILVSPKAQTSSGKALSPLSGGPSGSGSGLVSSAGAAPESDHMASVRRFALNGVEQLQEHVNSLRGELESTQAVMLALAISKLGNVLKKLMNGDAVDESQYVARPHLEESADSKERDKLEALKKLTFLTFDKAQAWVFKQRNAIQSAKSEAEISDLAAATGQLVRVFEAFK